MSDLRKICLEVCRAEQVHCHLTRLAANLLCPAEDPGEPNSHMTPRHVVTAAQCTYLFAGKGLHHHLLEMLMLQALCATCLQALQLSQAMLHALVGSS